MESIQSGQPAETRRRGYPVEPGKLAWSVRLNGPDDQVGRLHVDWADPVVWAPSEMIFDIMAGALHPNITIKDDLLTVRGDNLTVVYRIRQDDYPRDRYLMVWPD